MDSDRKTCVCGKYLFDKKSAQTSRNYLQKRGKAIMRIYQCDFEPYGWHVTRSTKYKYGKGYKDKK